jgi:hypothetical protein
MSLQTRLATWREHGSGDPTARQFFRKPLRKSRSLIGLVHDVIPAGAAMHTVIQKRDDEKDRAIRDLSLNLIGVFNVKNA